MNNKNKNIHQLLVFKREEMMFQVVNRLHILQKQLQNDSPDMHAIIEDIDDEHYEDEATRSMNLAYQEAVDIVYSLTKVPVEHDGSLDNTFGEPCHYTMAMRLPKDFSKGTVALLKNLVHEYIVTRIIEDWLKLTFPSQVEFWHKQASEIEEKIKTASVKRVKCFERPFNIF